MATPQDVLSSMDNKGTADQQTAFLLAGTKPIEIINHSELKTFHILGVTPSDFMKSHGTAQLDFESLSDEFVKVCKDYNDKLSLNTPSKAVEFCTKIIYTVGPESRKVKKADGDKTWKFMFTYEENKVPILRTAFVCTFKGNDVPGSYAFNNNKIALTIKQASLLAVNTLNKMNLISCVQNPPICLLTPLAGAIFSKVDMPSIASVRNSNLASVVESINASCQSGGQYLRASHLDIAAIATIVSTKGIKEDSVRKSFISKCVRQYISAKKVFNKERFNHYAQFAHGGVPSHLSPESLSSMFESSQTVGKRAMATASGQTEMKSDIDVPGSSGKKRFDKIGVDNKQLPPKPAQSSEDRDFNMKSQDHTEP